MHSSAFVALALAVAAAPALSIPLEAREPVDQSGAVSTGTIKDIVSIGNDVISGAQQVKDMITGQQRREFEELLARADGQSGASVESKVGLAGDIVDIGNEVIKGAQGIKNIITGKRDYEDFVVARGYEPSELAAREFVEELLAREPLSRTLMEEFPKNSRFAIARDDASGALNVGKIISGILRREDELLAREGPQTYPPRDETSGALNFGNIISGILKRDEELMAREPLNFGPIPKFRTTVVAREPVYPSLPPLPKNVPLRIARDEDSGAFNIGKIISGIVKRENPQTYPPRDENSGALNFGKIISGILKREAELLVREGPQTYPPRDEASGALNIISGILKRDEELLTREALNFKPKFRIAHEDELTARELTSIAKLIGKPKIGRDENSGALNFGKIISGIFKREGPQTYPPRDEDSGALNVGKIISGILKREDELPARATPASGPRPDRAGRVPNHGAHRHIDAAKPAVGPSVVPQPHAMRSLNELD